MFVAWDVENGNCDEEDDDDDLDNDDDNGATIALINDDAFKII